MDFSVVSHFKPCSDMFLNLSILFAFYLGSPLLLKWTRHIWPPCFFLFPCFWCLFEVEPFIIHNITCPNRAEHKKQTFLTDPLTKPWMKQWKRHENTHLSNKGGFFPPFLKKTSDGFSKHFLGGGFKPGLINMLVDLDHPARSRIKKLKHIWNHHLDHHFAYIFFDKPFSSKVQTVWWIIPNISGGFSKHFPNQRGFTGLAVCPSPTPRCCARRPNKTSSPKPAAWCVFLKIHLEPVFGHPGIRNGKMLAKNWIPRNKSILGKWFFLTNFPSFNKNLSLVNGWIIKGLLRNWGMFFVIMEWLQWIFLLQAEVEIWAWSCIIDLIIPLQCISRQTARSPGTKRFMEKSYPNLKGL